MFGPAVIGFSSRGCSITGSNGKIALRQGALQKAFHSASKRAAKAPAALSNPPATPPNTPSTVALTSPWPWRPITPSSKLPAHTILEERVIYARPLSFSPRKHLFLGCTLAGCGVMFWMMPDKPRMADWFSEDVGLFKRILGTINNYLFLDLPPFLAFAGTTLVAYRILFATARRVTKLSQIRTRSDGAQGIETKTSLKLQTGKQDLWGKGYGVRDLDIADVRVESVPGRAGKGYLSLTLRPEAIKHKWIERRPYYMDFRNSRFVAETNQEIVMSLNRVEHVFGKVQGA
ncbi:hypothetical protein I307_06169 [Cryptococcus deuterogattii 99/473]|uniref:Uncharacterized protein n=1 Tax=Cryptococcus deuterogattii Ram5 TaxID=1296110 RepID=A0A0D0SXV6_9TREE|nr:hypothetical protein I313_05997 [Cryptococcus deuterogattii Ram5]KIY54501.1 hypothetical protein I307_06169 [Cryptococcus deuterogattii 99/473]